MRFLKMVLLFLLIVICLSCKQSPTDPSASQDTNDYFPLSLNNKWYYSFNGTNNVSSIMIVNNTERMNNVINSSGTRIWQIINSSSFNDSTIYQVQDIYTGVQVWTWTDTSHQVHADTALITNSSGTFSIIQYKNDTILARQNSGYKDFPYLQIVTVKRHNDPASVTDTITVPIPTYTTMPGDNAQKIMLGKGLVYYTFVEGRVWNWSKYILKLDSVKFNNL